MERIDSSDTIAREISSRSANVNAIAARARSGGRNPPVSASIRWIDWLRKLASSSTGAVAEDQSCLRFTRPLALKVLC